MSRRPRRFAALYVLWIALCAFLFAALKNLENPARPDGRIVSNDAAAIAVAILRARDRDRFRGYEAVHVARARAGEGGSTERWIVVCDRVPHTALRDAVVVELERDSGKLLTVRRPLVR